MGNYVWLFTVLGTRTLDNIMENSSAVVAFLVIGKSLYAISFTYLAYASWCICCQPALSRTALHLSHQKLHLGFLSPSLQFSCTISWIFPISSVFQYNINGQWTDRQSRKKAEIYIQIVKQMKSWIDCFAIV